MFMLGDVVRLIRGWTPMIVIGFTSDGEVIAKYANNGWYPVRPQDYKTPHLSDSTYTRPVSGFVYYDGSPSKICKENYYMPRQFRSIKNPSITGFQRGIAGNGDIILERPNGSICTYDPSELEENIPPTFRVKAVGKSYTSHYLIPENASISVDDMLLSDSGNVYLVTEVDTKCSNPKGVFKGSRIQTERL